MAVAQGGGIGSGTYESLGNAGPWTPFGYAPEVTKSSTDPAEDEMSNIFGPRTKTIMDAVNRQNIPRDQQTLQSAFASARAYIMTIFRTNFEAADGWQFRFAPRERAPAMNYEWSAIKVNPVMLEPAPEGTAPMLVNYQSESHYGTLGRFGLGAREFNDFLKTSKGRSVWVMKLGAISSATVIAAKIMVGRAVSNSRSHFSEHMRTSGKTFGSINSVLERETLTFGAFADPLGIFKLDSLIKDLTRRNAGTIYDMAVVPPGTFNFIAWNSPKLTTVSEIGEKRVESVLSLGAQAMTGVLPGIEIFEDKRWALQNLSASELNQFQRVTTISCYAMIDGTTAGADQVGPDFDPSKFLSVQVRDMSIAEGGWSTVKINKDLLDASQRWAPDGTLSPHHKGMIANIAEIMQRTKISIVDGLVDPYVYRNTTRPVVAGNRVQSGEGFHVLEFWGDQDTRYRSLDFDETYGRHYRARVSEYLSERDLEALEDLQELSDMLRGIDTLDDESTVAFFLALAADHKNIRGKTWSEHRSSYLEKDAYGAPSLPHVEKNLTARHYTHSASKVYRPQLQASDFDGRGATFVESAKGERLYAWKLEVDKKLEYEFGVQEPQFFAANGNEDEDVAKAAFAKRFPDVPTAFMNEAQVKPNVRRNDDAVPWEAKQTGFGKDYAIVFAPFERFGPVASDGTAPQWNYAIPNDSPYRSKEAKFLDLPAVKRMAGDAGIADIVGVGSRDGAWDDINDEGEGFLPPRLIRAPAYPYGFSGFNGLKALGQYFVNGDMRGWSAEEIGAKAHRGMKAMGKLWEFEKSIHPDNELHDSTKVPFYMASGNDDLDGMYSTGVVGWQKEAHHALWVKIPSVDDSLGAPIFLLEASEAGFDDDDRRGFSDAQIDAIIAASGAVDGAGGVVDSNGVAMGVTMAELVDETRGLLGNAQLDARVLENMISEAGPTETFAAYKTGTLGPSYSNLRNVRQRDAVDRTDFAWFLADEVLRESRDDDEKASVMSGILGLAMASARGVLRRGQLTWKIIATLRAGSGARKGTTAEKRAREAEAADAIAGVARVDRRHQYVNTRLSVSNAFWKSVQARIRNKENVAAVYKIPLRPSNPLREWEPMASRLLPDRDSWNPDQWDDEPGAAGASYVAAADALSAFQHARGHWDSRGGFFVDDNVHGNPLRQPPPEMDVEGFSALDEGGTQPHIFLDPSGPFYVDETYASGEDPEPVTKDYFIKRFRGANNGNHHPLERYGRNGLLFSRVTRESILNMVREKVCPPTCSWLLVRPFIQFLMDAALWAQSGRQTARLLFDWSDLAFQYQAVTKKWFVHFTIWLDCAIFDPTKLVLWTDTKFSHYLGGMDTRFIWNAMQWDATDVDFEKIGSMFVMDLGGDSFSRSYALKTANPMSLFGNFNRDMFNYKLSRDLSEKLLHPTAMHPAVPFYEHIWSLTQMNKRAGPWKDASFTESKSRSFFPGVCFKGAERIWNHLTKSYENKDEARGTGHLKNWQPYNLLRVFNGQIPYKPEGVEE